MLHYKPSERLRYTIYITVSTTPFLFFHWKWTKSMLDRFFCNRSFALSYTVSQRHFVHAFRTRELSKTEEIKNLTIDLQRCTLLYIYAERYIIFHSLTWSIRRLHSIHITRKLPLERMESRNFLLLCVSDRKSKALILAQ